jgi:Cu/Ag efflux protein CusF
MRALRSLAVFGFALALLGASRGPLIRPYEVLLYGTVRSVDLRHGRITIAYAPLDTAPGGIRSMLVIDRGDLRLFERGDPIQAIADTRRTPWHVRDLHRMQ